MCSDQPFCQSMIRLMVLKWESTPQSHLLKGAFHGRPPLPRYTSTWDVNKVLQFAHALHVAARFDLLLRRI